jgi:hypothetical protein
MLNRMISALAIAGGIGVIGFTTALSPSALAQSASVQTQANYRQAMEADRFTLWNSGESQNVAFNVWKRPARAGGGFYYFMWEAPYASVVDRGDPEVVVFFDSNITQLNSEFLVECYNQGSAGSSCLKLESKPVHYRYTGSCIFPWQIASDGTACATDAQIARPGQF